MCHYVKQLDILYLIKSTHERMFKRQIRANIKSINKIEFIFYNNITFMSDTHREYIDMDQFYCDDFDINALIINERNSILDEEKEYELYQNLAKIANINFSINSIYDGKNAIDTMLERACGKTRCQINQAEQRIKKTIALAKQRREENKRITAEFLEKKYGSSLLSSPWYKKVKKTHLNGYITSTLLIFTAFILC